MAPLPNVEHATIISPSPEVAGWQRPRTHEELLGFIARREAVIFEDSDNDLFV